MSTNRYIDKLKVRLAKEADQRMQLQALLDDQVARNRALIAERDRLREDRDSQQRVCIAEMEKVTQLRAEVEALKKDAERYRWICSASYGAPSHPFIVINDFDSDKASIDAAIDAALQGAQP